MANPQIRHPENTARIDIEHDQDLSYWMCEFGCTAEQLRAAVREHGDSAEAIRQVLKRQGGANFMESDA